MKLLVLGASDEPICGTRDAASALASPLHEAGVETTTVWWDRGERTFASWLAAVETQARDADAVLWHYSPFTYGVRGVPLRVAPVLRTLRRTGLPVIVFFHELVYPLGRAHARGVVWALTQRLALLFVLRAAAGVVVTTEERGRWLRGARWLPSRPELFAPLFSNVRDTGAPAADGLVRIGVFGFRREALPIGEIVSALATVATRHPEVRLVLVGAPGGGSREGAQWRAETERQAAPGLLSFTGIVDDAQLGAELARLDIVLFPDPLGPTTRRGTLAAGLALGKPVIAFDGPQTWPDFVDEGALEIVPPSAAELAAALERLIEEPERRTALGRRGRAFYERRLGVSLAAANLAAFARRLAHD